MENYSDAFARMLSKGKRPRSVRRRQNNEHDRHNNEDNDDDDMNNTEMKKRREEFAAAVEAYRLAGELDYMAARWVAAGAQHVDTSAVLESDNLISYDVQKDITRKTTDKTTGKAPKPADPELITAPSADYEDEEHKAVMFMPRFEDAFMRVLHTITRYADGGLGAAIRGLAEHGRHPALVRFLRRHPATSYIFSTTAGNVFHAGQRHRNVTSTNRHSDDLCYFESTSMEVMLDELCRAAVPAGFVRDFQAQEIQNKYTIDIVGFFTQLKIRHIRKFGSMRQRQKEFDEALLNFIRNEGLYDDDDDDDEDYQPSDDSDSSSSGSSSSDSDNDSSGDSVTIESERIKCLERAEKLMKELESAQQRITTGTTLENLKNAVRTIHSHDSTSPLGIEDYEGIAGVIEVMIQNIDKSMSDTDKEIDSINKATEKLASQKDNINLEIQKLNIDITKKTNELNSARLTNPPKIRAELDKLNSTKRKKINDLRIIDGKLQENSQKLQTLSHQKKSLLVKSFKERKSYHEIHLLIIQMQISNQEQEVKDELRKVTNDIKNLTDPIPPPAAPVATDRMALVVGQHDAHDGPRGEVARAQGEAHSEGGGGGGSDHGQGGAEKGTGAKTGNGEHRIIVIEPHSVPEAIIEDVTDTDQAVDDLDEMDEDCVERFIKKHDQEYDDVNEEKMKNFINKKRDLDDFEPVSDELDKVDPASGALDGFEPVSDELDKVDPAQHLPITSMSITAAGITRASARSRVAQLLNGVQTSAAFQRLVRPRTEK